eukprot:8837781-Ditylum_brightwellii.AAC.1
MVLTTCGYDRSNDGSYFEGASIPCCQRNICWDKVRRRSDPDEVEGGIYAMSILVEGCVELMIGVDWNG